jgi:hypothetical protein
LFRPSSAHETIPAGDETISGFWRRRPETADGYQPCNENGGQRRYPKPETVKMRILSLILAFGFVLAGPSVAGLSEGGLPGIGSFAYSGSPITVSGPIVVAAR